MKTSVILPRLLGSLAVLAVLVLGITALAPTQALAVNCHCLNFFQEVHGWGSGTTCAAAEASCIASLASMEAATCEDGVCATQNFHWTNSCWTQSNGYKARDCAEDVKCLLCIDIPKEY